MHLALVALGIGRGDEVIVPSLTFIATANAVHYTGATPVFADSESETWNIDPEEIARLISPRTKAIIPIHLYGHPANMGPILKLANQHALHVVEDAAEAHGALYKGQRVGSLGVINAFSFYGNKIITTGEGGMLTTNDDNLNEKVRYLRDHAMSTKKRYWHTEVGFNYRMTNLQASIGVAQMERIEEFISRKHWIAQMYNQGLQGVSFIQTPPEASWAKSVFWMYSILLADDFPIGRDEVMTRLHDQGIDSRPFFYPIHLQPPYRDNMTLPIAENLARRGINLPSAVTLTEADIHRIVTAIKHMG